MKSSTPRGRVSWRRIGSGLSTAALLIAIGAWALLFRPTFLHGTTGYVIVSGSSMEPAYRSGDLVVTTPRAVYEVGDIVAYRAWPPGSTTDRLVIHRIVGGNAADGFVVRGDNRQRHDLWRPKPAEILGAAQLHVPRAGLVVAILQKPKTFAALLAGAVVFMAIMRLPGGKRDVPETPQASTHLLVLPSHLGYTILQQTGPPPAAGMRFTVAGLRLAVVRHTASQYPDDPRRCAVLEEMPSEPAATPQRQAPGSERRPRAA